MMPATMSRQKETAAPSPEQQNGIRKKIKNLQVNGEIKQSTQDEASRKRKRKHREVKTGDDRDGDEKPKKRKPLRPEKKIRLDEEPDVQALPIPETTLEEPRGSESASATRKGEKRRRKKDKSKTAPNGLINAQSLRDTDEAATQALSASTEPQARVKNKEHSKKPFTPDIPLRLPKGRWSTSKPIGGAFSDRDVAFTADEAHFLVLQPTGLQVFSSESSLLHRVINPTSFGNGLMDYALSVANPTQVYIATRDGTLTLWDFITGDRVTSWKLESTILYIRVIGTGRDGLLQDAVYSIDRKSLEGSSDSQYRVKYLDLTREASEQALQSVNLYSTDSAIDYLAIGDAGNVLFCAQGRSLIVLSATTTDVPLRNRRYNASKFGFEDWITCMDVRLVKRSKKGRQARIDVVVGNVHGVVYLYRDILEGLQAGDQSEIWAGSMAQKLHWHREGVHSVKFALNGEYILSGGAETVLVIWKLDTNDQQYLPHLSATIEAITVSPSGSSYALRLANNSIVIIGTADLEPTAYVAGLQITDGRRPRIPKDAQLHTRESEAAKRAPEGGNRISLFLHPREPSCLLSTVPSAQSSSLGLHPRPNKPYLQQFNLVTGRHMRRQALARTNVTDRNVGPANEKLQPADITCLSSSHDGQWLCSADEWIGVDAPTNKETYLKFWQWDQQGEEWVLNTRVDDPHSMADRLSDSSCQIIVNHPSRAEFASLGLDGIVRIWRPQRKVTNGVPAKDVRGSDVILWYCGTAIPIDSKEQWTPRQLLSSSVKPRNPRRERALGRPSLSYSEDGSCIAASLPVPTSHDDHADTSVYLINPRMGRIEYTFSDLALPYVLALGIINRHLVILSSSLLVIDLVSLSFQSIYPIAALSVSKAESSKKGFHNDAHASMHLTLDYDHGLFAVSLPPAPSSDKYDESKSKSRPKGLGTQIYVFSPLTSAPVHTASIPGSVLSLLTIPTPESESPGYLVLNDRAELRIVSPLGAGVLQIAQQAAFEAFGAPKTIEEDAKDRREERTGAMATTTGPGVTQDTDLDVEPQDIAPVHLNIVEQKKARLRAASGGLPLLQRSNAARDQSASQTGIEGAGADQSEIGGPRSKKEITALDLANIFDRAQIGVGGYTPVPVATMFDEVMALLRV